jgi:hypothetical protein
MTYQKYVTETSLAAALLAEAVTRCLDSIVRGKWVKEFLHKNFSDSP